MPQSGRENVSRTNPARRPRRSRLASWLIAGAVGGLLACGTTANAELQIFSLRDLSVTVPDNNPQGVTTTLEVTGVTGTIADINLSFDGDGPCSDTSTSNNVGLIHSWVGDLKLTLTSPSGTSVLFVDRPNGGQGGGNFCHTLFDDEAAAPFATSGVENAPFSGAWTPANLFSAFDGQNPNGTWTLKLVDLNNDDQGILRSWSLHIENESGNNQAPVVGFETPNVNDVHVTTATHNFTGTADDYDGTLTGVEYQSSTSITDPTLLPPENWQPVTNDSGDWTDWSVEIPLTSGTNTYVYARSIDDQGQTSVVARRTIFRESPVAATPEIILELPEGEFINNVYTIYVPNNVTKVNFSGYIEENGNSIQKLEYRVLGVDGSAYKPATLVDQGDTQTFSFQATLRTFTSPTQTSIVQTNLQYNFSNFTSLPYAVNVIAKLNNAPVGAFESPDIDLQLEETNTSYQFVGTTTDDFESVGSVEYRVRPPATDAIPFPTPSNYASAIDISDDSEPAWSRWMFDVSGLQPETFYNGDIVGGGNLIEVRFKDTQNPSNPSIISRTIELYDDYGPFPYAIISGGNPTNVPQTTDSLFISGSVTASHPTPISIVQYRSINSEGTSLWMDATNESGDWSLWSVNWDIVDGQNTIEVRARDTLGREAKPNANSKLTVTRTDNLGPSVAITSPPPGTVLAHDAPSTVHFAGTASDDLGLQTVTYNFYGPDDSLLVANGTPNNDSGDWTQWSVDIAVPIGTTRFEVFSTDTSAQVSSKKEVEVTREAPPIISPPTLTLYFPATNQTLSSSFSSILFSGSATSDDSTVVDVRYRTGPDALNLGPWTTVNNDSGDWTDWSFNLPLAFGANRVELEAEDATGLLSNTIVRIITRNSARPTLSISSPVSGISVPNASNTQLVMGSASDDVAVTTVDYRVTTENGFDSKSVSTAWLPANNDSGDWSAFSFNAPLGVGSNSIEVRALDGDGQAQANVVIIAVNRAEGGIAQDLFVLTPTTDIWQSVNTAGTFNAATRMNFTGFQYAPFTGWKTLPGDFNNDGLTDFVTITPWSEAWTVNNLGNGQLGTPTKQGSGYTVSNTNVDVLVGDFNGDNYDDLALVNQYGGVWQGLNNGAGSIPNPTYYPVNGFPYAPPVVHNPASGNVIAVGDFNGDGRDDLLRFDSTNASFMVARGKAAGGFENATAWSGTTGFRYNWSNYAFVVGDFNADGRDDVCQITEFYDAYTVLSTGTFFNPPAYWGAPGFRMEPNTGNGWWVLAGDVNGDAADDLIQINEFGEAWVAASNSLNGFDAPVLNAQLGFLHRPQGLWQTFVGKTGALNN